MSTPATADPFAILGVAVDAGEAEIRARYLELVKRFPPEREPDKFREIRTAFEAASDPLTLAKRLIAPPGEEPPRWADAIEMHKRIPPALSPQFLLSLGNRDPQYQRPAEAPAADAVSRTAHHDPDRSL